VPAKLKLIVSPETSIIVRDRKTKEIALVVMHNACRDEGAVVTVDAIVSDATKLKKLVRVSELISFLYLGH